MIEIIASASVGATVGFLTCAFLAAGKVNDLQDQRDEALDAKAAEILPHVNLIIAKQAAEATSAHARCADSRNTLLSRIDRLRSIALSQQSVKSGRIVAVLNGEA